MKHLIQSNIYLLKQLSEVVTQLKDDDYALPLDIYSASSVGQHTRHILCFFDCLFQAYATGEVCFDNRQRKVTIEQNVQVAYHEIERIVTLLPTVKEDRGVKLLSIADGEESVMDSSIARELLYVQEHTVHHLAIIKMGVLHDFSYVKFPDDFGVAQSTIDYQKQS